MIITAAAIKSTAATSVPSAPLADVGPEDLSPREHDVLRLIAGGLSNQEIAATLYVSINSVKTYIRSAYRKIGVGRRSQAVVWAVQHGLLEIPRAAGTDDEASGPGASDWLASA